MFSIFAEIFSNSFDADLLYVENICILSTSCNTSQFMLNSLLNSELIAFFPFNRNKEYTASVWLKEKDR